MNVKEDKNKKIKMSKIDLLVCLNDKSDAAFFQIKDHWCVPVFSAEKYVYLDI